MLVPEDLKLTTSFQPNRNSIETNLPYPYGNLPQKDTLFNNINYEYVGS